MKRRETTAQEMKNTKFLPWELIIEILLRLPVKSLVRFRCVCKSWLSLISDFDFANSHFELAVTSKEKLVFLAPYARKIQSIDFNASIHIDYASIALKPEFMPHVYPFRIIGSCRGFLLLECLRSLWIWNPSTGVHKKVSRSPIVFDINTSFSPFLYGFGYDPSTNDYLVIQASSESYDDHSPTHVEYFALRGNRWKEIEGIHLPYMHCDNGVGVGSFLSGSIHWFGFRYDGRINVIVAFDLMKMRFSEIPGPIDFEWDDNLCNLAVLGEFLGLCAVGYFPSRRVEIWMMREYKVQSSWTKIINVPMHDISNEFFTLICSTENGDIVGKDVSNGLMKCNYRGELQEYRPNCCDQYMSQVVVYTESLLSLPCDSKQDEENN